MFMGVVAADDLDSGLVFFNPLLRHKVPKNDAFTDHEVALFLVKYQVLLASLQVFV
jgi:hypothetical protein